MCIAHTSRSTKILYIIDISNLPVKYHHHIIQLVRVSHCERKFDDRIDG